MLFAQWLAHGGAADAGPVLLMVGSAGTLYGIGIVLCLIPVVRGMTNSLDQPSEAEKLAADMLGEEQAKEQAARARRLRSINRREVRETISTGGRSSNNDAG
jgi:hypothetical protein